MPLPDKWIAKKIAKFGRYKHTRPPGLHVDSYGALKLENLMAVWGHPRGLDRDTVVQAVQNHAINDRKRISRFTLYKDSSGLTILVHSRSKEALQKRRSQQGDANQADKANDDSQAGKAARAWQKQARENNIDWSKDDNSNDSQAVEAARPVLKTENKKAAGSKGASYQAYQAASATVVATNPRKTKNKMPRPRKPPGKHWTMYTDQGTDWWYYEGPLGKWYMGVDDEKPQLYYDTEFTECE